MIDTVLSKGAMLSKKEIRRSFSKSAESYDAVAHPQREFATALVSFAERVAPDFFEGSSSRHFDSSSTVLDIGSGTGYLPEVLSAKGYTLNPIRLDLSESMLQYEKLQSKNGQWLCADMDALPIRNNSVDLVLSGFALQWSVDFSAMLKTISSICKKEACFLFSIPGPKTFFEIRDAWNKVDAVTHVHLFNDRESIERSLELSGFECLGFESATKTMLYPSAKEALLHIKKIGAHNMSENRERHLMGKNRFYKFLSAYEEQMINGQYPLSYESYFVLVKKKM